MIRQVRMAGIASHATGGKLASGWNADVSAVCRPGASASPFAPRFARAVESVKAKLRTLLESQALQRVFWNFLLSNQPPRHLEHVLGIQVSLALWAHTGKGCSSAGFKFG